MQFNFEHLLITNFSLAKASTFGNYSYFCNGIIKGGKTMKVKVGDNVMISPEVTNKDDWEKGKVIEVEANPFIGTVISAETADGEIYFEKECLFKLVS